MQPFAFHGHNRPVMAIQFNHDGDLLFSAGKDGMIAAWRTSDGERLGTYTGHKTVSDLDVNHASTMLASTGGDFKTYIWNAQTGDALVDIELKCPARCIKFAHDDSMFLNVTDGKMGEKPSIHIYNLPASIGVQPVRAAFNPFVTYTTPEQMMYAQWGPTNDTIYFCSDDGSVSILDVETQKEITSAMPHHDEVRKIHFDPTYRTLVTASKDKSAKLLDSRSLKTICTYQTDTPVNDISVSPIFDHIVLGGGTEAQDVTTTGGGSSFNAKFYHKVHETLLGQMQCHFGTINCCAFAPDGKSFATGAVDGFVKLNKFEDSYFSSPGSVPVWTAEAEEEEEEEAEADDEEEEEE